MINGFDILKQCVLKINHPMQEIFLINTIFMTKMLNSGSLFFKKKFSSINLIMKINKIKKSIFDIGYVYKIKNVNDDDKILYIRSCEDINKCMSRHFIDCYAANNNKKKLCYEKI